MDQEKWCNEDKGVEDEDGWFLLNGEFFAGVHVDDFLQLCFRKMELMWRMMPHFIIYSRTRNVYLSSANLGAGLR